MQKSILFLNGPNLNLLGTREPEVYGYQSLVDIENNIKKLAALSEIKVDCIQSNREYELIEAIHSTLTKKYSYAIINPAAFTHTSIGLRDAFLGVDLPFIEVHLSNVYKREQFRHHSYLSDIAAGVIVGMGSYGYELALLRVIAQLKGI